MLFNSLGYAIFLPLIFILYWSIPSKLWRQQNLLLLLASYFFYGCWDWRFVFLLGFSTVLDYYTGLRIQSEQSPSSKKFWLWLSIAINLGFLSIFKYFNFFIDSMIDVGIDIPHVVLKIVLPVGISFYTFHGLSYVIDIYYGRIKPEGNFATYALFVSFFPLLVAGPIERATHLLPQLKKDRFFNRSEATDGLRQILWGLFKKVVVADNCATLADQVFNNSSHQSGSTLIAGAFFFAFQIYCDFSGYSDIALGSAKLFGIRLLRNFAYPYFSRDIAEFWRRWHISLSSWFKDYLYIPLGGSRVNKLLQIRNTFIIFIISGFWHGANWTFIAWGFLNALYFIPLLLLNKNRVHVEIVADDRSFPSLKELAQMATTFAMTTVAWIFFRADSISHAISIFDRILSSSTLSLPRLINPKLALLAFLFIGILVTLEWIGRNNQHALERLALSWNRFYRLAIYILFIFMIGMYMQTDETPFIYFQF
ncbi:MAG TPA: MBOAT family O-acyltransferase [Chryseolinea sp.]|nr:MBOAT family O-acyltransferase [Chryseolinea sp.]